MYSLVVVYLFYKMSNSVNITQKQLDFCNKHFTRFITDPTEILLEEKKENIRLNSPHRCCGFDYKYDQEKDDYIISKCDNVITDDYVCSKHSYISVELNAYKYKLFEKISGEDTDPEEYHIKENFAHDEFTDYDSKIIIIHLGH